MTIDNDLSPDEIRMLDNGSAEAWDRLTDKEKEVMQSWGLGSAPGGEPGAAHSESATPEPSGASEIDDARLTPEQRAAGEAALAPPTRPQDYRHPDPLPGMEPLAPEDDRMLRDFFVGAEIDQSEAYFVTNEIYRARGADQSAAALALGKSTAAAELSRAWGPDYEANKKTVDAELMSLIDELPESERPDAVAAFKTTQLGNSVVLSKLLLKRAQRRGSA